jgi:uncharacterized protein (TIGR02271 family)
MSATISLTPQREGTSMSHHHSHIVGVFSSREAAERAIEDLHGAGFTGSQIGIAARESGSSGTLDTANAGDTDSEAGTGAMTGALAGAGLGALAGLGILAGVIPIVGPAIAGGTLGIILSNAAAGAGLAGLTGALVGAGMSEDDAGYYQSEFESGRTIVTVEAGSRADDARRILMRHGMIERSGASTTSGGMGLSGDGHDHSQHNAIPEHTASAGSNAAGMVGMAPACGTGTGTATGASTSGMATHERAGHAHATSASGEQTVRLHEEQLHAHTQPVAAGEVRVRKEVITEHKAIEVPVEREEIVIERHAPTTGHATSDAIRAGEEIRIPVMEEKVVVEKQAVVKEEVTIGKRTVQDTERVAGTVRKEELRVERQGDVDIHGDTGKRS